MSHLYLLATGLSVSVLTVTGASSSGLPPQIPSVATFLPVTSDAPFVMSPKVRIVVDAEYASKGSPSLREFAETFRGDLIDVSGFSHIPDVTVSSPTTGTNNPIIFLSLGAISNHTFFNGKETGEGYDFHISEGFYAIKGVQPIGAWWGTRTLLQQLAMLMEGSSPVSSVRAQNIAIPAGTGSDTPGWGIRGFMLDAGRHWFETSFLSDLCTYASFFKLNEFQIHASENLWNPAFLYGDGNEGWKHLYAGFRFRPSSGSALEGLVPMQNESWTKDQFTALQSNCAAHGITIIPEIDTPGHSLAISQWKPQLMISGEPEDLNLSHPDTIPTIKSIWDEFLPWFTAPEVSIGADEYDPALADDYISFVNEMGDYLQWQGNKFLRCWGTLEPSETMSISKNVTIQHWNFPGDDIPVQLMNDGYHIINSEQYFLYLDGKTSDEGQFPQELNQTLIWHGAPGRKGWAPNIFSPNDASNNTSIDNPRLRGSVFALWNDWGNNATTQLEIYYQLARSMAAFSEKTWAGSEVRDTALTQAQFNQVYPTLNAKQWWTTTMDIWGEYMAVGNMSFAAPAKTIGENGFQGRFGKIELKLGTCQYVSAISFDGCVNRG